MDIAAILGEIRPASEWVLSGDDYDGLDWHSDDPKPTLAEIEKAWPSVRDKLAWEPIRARRNALLAASDWTQIPDAPVDTKAWEKYRQALRDLPETITDPTMPVDWPEPPK